MTETAADLKTVSIVDEMKSSYLDYAMSVIVSRAIPDARDGLKPVHRRILYAMLESGCDYNKAYKKSARIVGEVMGKYHPHGDSAIYDALVRMAQPFSMGQMLVDGQGNFGSMDGDPPAAMRYTESRLAKIAQLAMLEDLDRGTVDFQENYDGSEQEPVVLPAQFPNLLVNGAGGIAVGMATNIPPYNLGEVLDACCHLIDQPDASIEELVQIVPAPDFPTGGLILGRGGSLQAAQTGRGSVLMRGKTEIEEIRKDRWAIIINEIPYQVNKARLVERIAELVREKKIEGIADLRDESDKQGVRVVVEIKREATPDVVLNQLYSFTPLQTSFGVNMLALNGGRPELMNLRSVLTSFIAFREEVIDRRTRFLLGKARDKAHVLIGLAIAVANIDEVIAVIRAAKDPAEARAELMRRDWHAADVLPLLALVDDRGNRVEGGRIRFTEAQARAILDLRLQKLTGLEQEKIHEELKALAEEITGYLEILGSRDRLYELMRGEFLAVKEQYAIPRRTQIELGDFDQDIEDLIEREEMVVTITMNGYIKRTPLATYRAQRRGGKGRSAMSTRDEDVTTEVFVTNTHTPVLFFSSHGKVYRRKVYKLPLGSPQSRGKALVNMFPLAEGEVITNFMPMPEDESEWENYSILFATSSGNVRRNDLSDFTHIMANGKIAIRLDEGDSLVGVLHCNENDHVLLAARSGKSVRFPVSGLRVFKSRTSTGVRGMKLAEGDRVVSLAILQGHEIDNPEERDAYIRYMNAQRRAAGEETDEEMPDAPWEAERLAQVQEGEEFLLTITENGFGKRSSAYEYRTTNRGGSGIVNIVTSARNGGVVASFPVKDKDQIMLMTNAGTLIRCPIHDVRIAGRNTQGVNLFTLHEGERVVSATRIAEEEEELEEEVGETTES